MTGCPALLLSLATCFLLGCSSLNPISTVLERELPQPEHASSFEHRATIMRTSDGIDLHTEVFSPAGGDSETPCIIVRLPLPAGTLYSLYRSAFGAVWARRGYTTVVQNVRGFLPSRGTFEPFRFERADGLELLAWLDDQKLCRGPKTTWGGSYFGLTQWAIGDKLEGSKAIQIASPRLAEVFFPGGAFALETALYWSARNLDKEPNVSEMRESTLSRAVIDSDDHLLGGDDPSFDAWFLRGRDPSYWQSQFPHADGTMQGPVFLMAGWFDPFLPAMLKDAEELASRGEEVKITIGPWAHAHTVPLPDGHREPNYRVESLSRPIEWLRCRANPHCSTHCSTSPVEIFVMGSNRWLHTTSYPPPGVNKDVWTLDLHSRTLHTNASTSTAQATRTHSVSLTLDPRDPTPGIGGIALGENAGPLSQAELVERAEVFTVSSLPLESSITIIGAPKLRGKIGKHECSPDLAATLIDVFPDGSRYLVTEGILRTSSLEDPTTVEVSLWPTAYTFEQGHRSEIVLAPAKFPRYDLPPCVISRRDAPITLTLEEAPARPWTLYLTTEPR